MGLCAGVLTETDTVTDVNGFQTHFISLSLGLYQYECIITSLHTVDTEFSVTNFFCLHFSEHAQWGLPVMSDILVKIFVDISCNICGLFLL